MIDTWRVTAAAFAQSIFSGEGARRFGGRWNSPGNPVVYTSQDQSLAVLETLVHIHRYDAEPFVMAFAAIPDKLIETVDVARLPDHWRDFPASPDLRIIGDRWLANASSAVLRVPSVIIETNFNYLINIDHPDADQITFGPCIPFRFDPRLINSS